MWSPGWPSPRRSRTSPWPRRPRPGGRRAGWCSAAPWSCSAWCCWWTGSPPTWTSCSGRWRWSPSGSRSCSWGCGDDAGGRTRGLAWTRGAPMTTEPVPPAPADRHGPAAATVLVGALLVLVGIGWLLDAGGVGVPWRAVLPAALIAVGLACVAGAFRGRQHAMMVLGLTLTVVLAVAVATDWDLDVPLAGGVRGLSERPAH